MISASVVRRKISFSFFPLAFARLRSDIINLILRRKVDAFVFSKGFVQKLIWIVLTSDKRRAYSNALQESLKKKIMRSVAKKASTVRGEKALRERVSVLLGLLFLYSQNVFNHMKQRNPRGPLNALGAVVGSGRFTKHNYRRLRHV